MPVTPKEIQALRERSGAGMMDCKRALEECSGDAAKAMDLLRERGIMKGAKRADRVAGEGVIGVYPHHDKKMAVLVELNSETDFVARTEEFQELAKNLAMQIGARSPLYVSRDQVPEALIEHERKVHRAQAETEGKPAGAIDKIAASTCGSRRSACSSSRIFAMSRARCKTWSMTWSPACAKRWPSGASCASR